MRYTVLALESGVEIARYEHVDREDLWYYTGLSGEALDRFRSSLILTGTAHHTNYDDEPNRFIVGYEEI